MSRVVTEPSERVVDLPLLRRLWRFVRPYRALLLGQLVLLPLAALAQAAQPYLTKRVIDDNVIPGRSEGLWVLVAVFVALLAVTNMIQYGSFVLGTRLGACTVHDLRVALYRHVTGQALRFFDREPVGRVMTRLTADLDAISEMFASGIVLVVADVVKVLVVLAVLLLLSVKLTGVALVVMAVLTVLVLLFRGILRRVHRRIRVAVAALNVFLQEHLAGTAVVTLFGRQQRVREGFDRLNRRHADLNYASIRADAVLFAVVEALGTVAIAGILWVGSGDLLRGALTFGTLVAFVGYIQQLFGPLRDLSSRFAVLQAAMAGSEKVFGLLDQHDPDAEARLSPDPTPVGAASDAHVSFARVYFAYTPGEPVLEGLDLTVRRGETLALVGHTGCGKTTLVHLLTRLYELDSGRILLGPDDVARLDRRELRRRVVTVGQDPVLLGGTVRDNITLGDPLSDEAIRRAVRFVGLDRLLGARGRDLASAVAPRGQNLSAGERQLVCFARALVRDPEVLVLDEAFASVDPEAEAAIQAGVARLAVGRTAIVVAHRLSTVRRADRIAVLHAGRVAELGTHEELLAAGGRYCALRRLHDNAWQG